MSADILTQAISRNLLTASGALNGSEVAEHGRTTATKPRSGDIIFFGCDNKGLSDPQDGESDHVGIFEEAENGIIYTVESNSADSSRENYYAVGYYEILGFGVALNFISAV